MIGIACTLGVVQGSEVAETAEESQALLNDFVNFIKSRKVVVS